MGFPSSSIAPLNLASSRRVMSEMNIRFSCVWNGLMVAPPESYGSGNPKKILTVDEYRARYQTYSPEIMPQMRPRYRNVGLAQCFHQLVDGAIHVLVRAAVF